MLLEPNKAQLILRTIAHLHNFLSNSSSSRNLYTPHGTFDEEINGELIEEKDCAGRAGISRADDVRLLGVLFDTTLTFGPHIDLLFERLRKVCYVHRLISKYCSQRVLLSLYYASFSSQLSYGIIVWGSGN
ncbi:hypothetical protein QE152_g5585 [Popillia japonica]|uniref:Uncharacterized protein n=1 Tax=Popillia japonica TaxID=7064 RepID=A0AAW1MK50_POPJA